MKYEQISHIEYYRIIYLKILSIFIDLKEIMKYNLNATKEIM